MKKAASLHAPYYLRPGGASITTRVTNHWLNSAAAACRPKVACRDSNAPSQQGQLKRNGISCGELGDARPYRSIWAANGQEH